MSADASRDERLQVVLLDYLKAVDAGHSPSRDELLRCHPDLAGELDAFFADQARVDRAVDPFRTTGQQQTAEAPTLPPQAAHCRFSPSRSRAKLSFLGVWQDPLTASF
jgi:hypothetical protein